MRSSGRGWSEGDLDGALGGVDAGADHLARAIPRPCRCAGRGPSRSRACRRRCGRCPCGSRRAASRRPPRRRRGSACRRRTRASMSLSRKRDRAALAALGVAEPMIGWKRSMCRRVAVAVALQVLVEARRASRPGRRRTSRARASPGTARRGRRGSCARARRCAARAAGSRRGARSSARSWSPKITSSSVRAECRCTTSSQRAARSRCAQHAHDRRDAAAGADEQQLLRQRARAARSRPPPRRGARSRRAWPRGTRNGETLPSSTSLGVIADAAVGAAGVGGQRVGAPVVHAVDRPRRCAGTGPARGPATPSPA